MTTHQLLEEASSLPIEERAALVDSLLKTLNAPESAVDEKWSEVAHRRLQELRSGNVQTKRVQIP